jgi:hypothetical protein
VQLHGHEPSTGIVDCPAALAAKTPFRQLENSGPPDENNSRRQSSEEVSSARKRAGDKFVPRPRFRIYFARRFVLA